MGAFFTPVFRRFATQALYNLIASAFARKSRIRLATHKNQWIFTYFLFSRRRKARSKARNRGQTWYRKRHPKCNTKSSFLSILHLSGCNSHKTSNRSVPGAHPGGGKGPKIDPKAAKSSPRWTLDAPKKLFGTFHKNKSNPFPLRPPS